MAFKFFTFAKHKGLNRVAAPHNMSPEYAYDLLNCYVNKDGAITQRNGIAKKNTTVISGSPKVRTIFEAGWNSLARDIIVRAGTAWRKYNSGMGVFDDLDTGRTDDAIGDAVMFDNELIMVDGGTPRKCVSTYTVSDLGGSPPSDPTAVHVHQHKVWMNSVSNPMKAYYSKTDDAENWTAAGDAGSLDFTRILPQGDTLIGFATFAEAFLVFIFKQHLVIYTAGTDPAQFSIQQIIDIGAFSNQSVLQVANDLVFPTYSGIRSIKSSLANQKLDLNDLSALISPLYRTYADSITNKTTIAGVYYNKLNHYYLCFPLSSGHTILVYSPDVKNVVGRYTGITAYSFMQAEDGTLYCGGDGYVYTMDSSSDDDGAAIEFRWKMPFLYFDNPIRYKAPRELEILVQHASNITLKFDYWYGLTALESDRITKSLSLTGNAAFYREALYRASYYRASGKSLVRTQDLKGRGKMMQCEIWHNTNGAQVTIPYFTLGVAMEGIK